MEKSNTFFGATRVNKREKRRDALANVKDFFGSHRHYSTSL